MSGQICVREDELLDALGRGFIGDELSSHIDSCEPCHELQMVAGALLDDRNEMMDHASVPSSGTMWWRMQVRHRHDAEARARRSLLVGQAFSLAVAIALLIGLFGSDVALSVKQAVTSIHLSTPVLLAIVTTIVLAPIAGWVAIRQK